MALGRSCAADRHWTAQEKDARQSPLSGSGSGGRGVLFESQVLADGAVGKLGTVAIGRKPA